MPNSRIEISPFISDDILETLGAWTTDGNTLLGGGGDLLGSTDNFGFFFITNDIRRGGFLNTGEFFLQQSSANGNHRSVSKASRFETNDALDFTALSFTLPLTTTYNFRARVQYRSDGGNDWGGFERIVMADRQAASTISNQTFPYTERFGSAAVNARWALSGNDVELLFNGLAATNFVWTATIEYQGVLNA